MNHYTNKKSLALLGHGKWKSALGHTLLLIGMVLVSMGAFAQNVDPSHPNIPEGLVMNKYFVPDNPANGTSGNIFLETYVTGHSVAQHKPTDIVLVLDVSGSMDQTMTSYTYTARASQNYSYNGYGNNNTYYIKHSNGQYYPVVRQTQGNRPTYYRLRYQVNTTWYYLSGTGVTTTAPNNVTSNTGVIWTGVLYTRASAGDKNKLEALQEAVCDFVDNIAEDAVNYQVDHRISIVKYAMNVWATTEGDITEGDDSYYYSSSLQNANYTQVVINRRAPRTEAQFIKDAVNGLHAGGATAADYGMNKARYVLKSILDEDGAEEFNKRQKVVVMFTDGAPTYESNFSTTVAGNTIAYAYNLKHSWTDNGTTYAFNAPVFTIGVFDNETDNIRNYMNRTSSNYPDATGWNNPGTQDSEDYYYKAESADGLKEIFTTIAGASGAMALPAATIVQDAVSPNFELPNGASDVTAYAPKYYYDEDAEEYKFEDLNDAGTLVIGTITDPETGNPITGVVMEDDPQCGENKLPSDFIRLVGTDKIQMTNFNFSHHWVGTEEDVHGNLTAHGRKIVIKIHIEIADGGSWGDGIATNDPLNSYIQAPDPNNPGQFVYYGPFPPTSANVMGSVWTEVVTVKPSTFIVKNASGQVVTTIEGDGSGLTAEIGTPEDLAWFISEVNGRIGYTVHGSVPNSNTVASHPKLNGKLTADIDMSRHNWVPIGCGWQVEIDPNSTEGLTRFKEVNGAKVHMCYEGTFDGNGYVITGLKNNASKFYKQIVQNQGGVVVFPGMFSDVKGTIKNVFVLDADFRGKNRNGDFVHHGIIADTLEAGGSIFNCEAAGRITCNNDPGNPDYKPSEDQNLKYGGLVGLNRGNIHSCMAMAELSGYTMGGMIAENEGAGKFSNGFTNGVFNYLGTTAGAENKPVAGIVAINPTAANVSNCYVRFSRESSGLNQTTGFRQIAGGNNFDSQSCYSPSLPEHATEILTVNTAWNQTIPSNGFGIDYTNTRNQSRMREDRSNDNMVGGAWEAVNWTDDLGVEHLDYMILDGGTPLLKKLNAGVASGQASWKRTTAIGNNYNLQSSPDGGNINGDYPILEFSDFNCVASADGIRLDYAASLDQMLERHNSGNMNVNTNIPNAQNGETGVAYNVSEAPAIYGGAINLYKNDGNVTKSTVSGSKDGVSTVVYIDENVSLLQDEDSQITAYTGQTIKDFGSSYTEDGVRWHNVSSSLTGSQFGWTYDETGQVPHAWGPNWASWVAAHEGADPKNPCLIHLNVDNDDIALFPTDARSFNVIDFYCFYEPKYHWINFKRNSNSHWHMDAGYTTPLVYNNEEGTGNEDHFIPGKGYLLALYTEYFGDRHLWNDNNDGSKNGQFLQNRGTLNNGNVDIPVTYTTDAIIDLDGYKTGLEGYNLLGNPYQSFLDFDAFVEGNSGLWTGSKFEETCAIYDPESNAYLQIPHTTPSEGAKAAGPTINMHQGFFIQVGSNGTAHFTNDMRTNDATPNFRGERPTYPLINFIVKDYEGNTDVAVLELNRPENDGAKKLRMGSPAGRIYFRYDNENLAIYFRNSDKDYQTLNFAAEEDGNFTLNWERANDNFSSLTLVDNITGIKTDMLTHDHYTFEGRVDDYNTRFKIVFGEMDTNEEEPVLEHFAFFDHGNLIVNGTGHFEVVDVLGRVVYATELTDTQNTVSLPSNVRGVCMLCFTRNNETKVQKMMIQ
ncbi:MAG: hypothetical protein IKS53_06930 [Bacteroidales bacterium]|nr:hypothetical protein [Bacteroidales bacterium]